MSLRCLLHYHRQLQALQILSLTFEGADFADTGTRWCMAPDDLNARNLVGQEPEVNVEQERMASTPTKPTFAPHSVTLYRLEVR